MKTKKLRILTFNHHESYLCLLASLGHDFDVVIRKKNLDLSWSASARSMPKNMQAIDFELAKSRSEAGEYDLVIAHTVMNLFWLLALKPLPVIFVIHIYLHKYNLKMQIKSLLKVLVVKIFKALRSLEIVGVSPTKFASWRVSGEVIPLVPGEVPQWKPDWQNPHFIVVGNRLAERGEEVGFLKIQEMAEHLPIKFVGYNPGISNSIKPRDLKDFFFHFSQAIGFLYTTQPPHNDGYNTAMLEAMKMGMPVLSLNMSSTSPIKDEFNGLCSYDVEILVDKARQLLSDPEKARYLGSNAKETISQQFSDQTFLNMWSELIQVMIQRCEANA